MYANLYFANHTVERYMRNAAIVARILRLCHARDHRTH